MNKGNSFVILLILNICSFMLSAQGTLFSISLEDTCIAHQPTIIISKENSNCKFHLDTNKVDEKKIVIDSLFIINKSGNKIHIQYWSFAADNIRSSVSAQYRDYEMSLNEKIPINFFFKSWRKGNQSSRGPIFIITIGTCTFYYTINFNVDWHYFDELYHLDNDSN
jgi:hypothetical protein